jgi:hypothetical protein
LFNMRLFPNLHANSLPHDRCQFLDNYRLTYSQCCHNWQFAMTTVSLIIKQLHQEIRYVYAQTSRSCITNVKLALSYEHGSSG